MKTSRWAASLLVALAILSGRPLLRAQTYPLAEIELSFVATNRDYGADRLTPVGFHFSGWYGVHRFLRLGGEVAGEYRPTPDLMYGDKRVKMRDYQLLAGPEFVFRNGSKVAPFVHALGGFATRHYNAGNNHYYCGDSGCDEHEDTLAHESGYGFALGGGIDVRVHPQILLRVVQFDYLRTHMNRHGRMLLDPISLPGLQSWQKSYRFSIGVVVQLGEHGSVRVR